MPNLEGQPTAQPGPQYPQESYPPGKQPMTVEYGIGRFDHLTERIEALENLVSELIADKTHTHRTMGGQ